VQNPRGTLFPDSGNFLREIDMMTIVGETLHWWEAAGWREAG